MWALRNHTPYTAARGWGRDKDGRHEWLVAIKAVFDIFPDGSVALANEQFKPLLLPEYTGEPGASSLRYDVDLVPPKPTTDILVNGTAFAPGGYPSKQFEVGFAIGAVRKALLVRGNRAFHSGLLGRAFAHIEPVTKVPIIYERAYGGSDRIDADPSRQRRDARNPVGCGAVAQTHDCVDPVMPNFEYPDRLIGDTGPAGFGPIDSFWAPRSTWAGTFDESWWRERFPLVPADWDPRWLLCSPVDQRPARHLVGGETVHLHNLTPSGSFQFRLPRLDFRLSTRIKKYTEEHQAKLGTVIIEPDYHRVIMVWHSSILCPCDGDYLEWTAVSEES
jgi:hypothetical protein